MDISRETLERLYVTERKSLAEIGLLYGKHRNQIRRWLIRESIPVRSISEAQRGKPHPVSPEHAEKLRKILREKANPARTSESFARQGAKIKGRVPHNRGKPWTPEERATHMAYRQTPEYRAKQAKAVPSGEKHHNWKGGHEARAPRGWEWKVRRRECYERDNWTCRDCGEKCHNGRRIQAHHVIPRRLGGSDDLQNLVTLCVSCHRKREALYGDALIV